LRIIVLVLVPVIALIGLYGLLLSLSLNSLVSLREAETVRGEITTPVTNVQLQVSRERMDALAYLANPTHYRLGVLLTQEARADSTIETYDNVTAVALAKGVQGERVAIRNWSAQLGTLRALRESVVSLGLSRAAAATSYSALVIGGNNVINQALLPLLATPDIVQANNLLVLEQSLQAESEESNLFLADLDVHSYPGIDQRLILQLIVQHRELWNQAMAGLSPAYQKIFATDIPAAASAHIAAAESQIIAGPRSAMRLSATKWNSATHAYNAGFINALHAAANAVRQTAVNQASSLVLRLLLIAALGLLTIAAAITVAIIVSRNLLREINDLRTSAIALSSQRLPALLGRLRSGAEVDIENETPQLEIEDNEIGELRRAINYTARAAIGAAVDEVAIRRGVNDMFRNLARRNQSLLTRQLELLDSMERRVHDPEELADLFRVDHLTTRMRRHAEGLLIVAGGSSGRVWREPVPVIDVMRAAVAEVEDYTRIRVTSRSNASVAGHAVADIIHLLAELVENATTFSPANTPVRIESDNVAKGLIVEIEDRGLGMGDEQIAQINTTLSDPPLFDLSGSEQLGLYIAGQLAARHNVKITMRGSAYGGVIAVVLIPSALIADAGYDEPPTVVGIRELGGRPVPQLPGPSSRRETTVPEVAAAREDLAVSADYAGSTGYLMNLEAAATAVASQSQPGTGPFEPIEPLPPLTSDSSVGWPEYAADSPVSTTVTSSGWLNLPGSQPDARLADGIGGIGALGSLDGFEDLPHRESTLPQRETLPMRESRLPEPEPDTDSLALAGFEGLPVRVRQANLAPQLRDEGRPVPAQGSQYVPAPDMAPGQVPPDAGEPDASPEAARNFMSSLQRGWERGRSMAEHLTDEPDGEQS
jgi:anti-sigma regulatory factor (Ser/Thr protein kinase)